MNRFEAIISKHRADSYRLAGDTETEVFNRYIYNVRLSEAFYPTLHFLEIALRNRINDIFIEDFGVDWLTNGKVLLQGEADTVIGARDTLTKQRKEITNYRLVAELSFGFWSSLFSNKYVAVWKANKRIRRIFPNSSIGVKEINKDLNDIRRFRNRIFHFERIFNHKPEDMHNNILLYIEAILPDKALLAEILKTDRFEQIKP